MHKVTTDLGLGVWAQFYPIWIRYCHRTESGFEHLRVSPLALLRTVT
jgi:hypothetical protein